MPLTVANALHDRHWRRRARISLLVLDLIATLGFAGFLGWSLIVDDSTTVFRIEARSSSITVTASKEQPAWPASIAIVPVPHGCVNPTFRPSPGSTITVSQRGEQAAYLDVTAKSGPENPSAGVFSCADGAQMAAASDVGAELSVMAAMAAGNFAVAKMRKGGETASPAPQPITLRFAGVLRLGSEIDNGDPVPLLLENGNLIMETQPLIGPGRAESIYHLSKGDVVTFTSPRDEQSLGTSEYQDDAALAGPIAFGFVSFERQSDDPFGFQVIARARASRALVLPYGRVNADSIAVAPDLLARARAGARALVLGALGALALHALALIVDWLELPHPHRSRETEL